MVVKRSFSFGPSPKQQLLRPLLTSRSGLRRRPFRHEARSPQVRTQSFPAQSSHLRHLALTTRASQSLACSPCSVPPSMRFVYLDSRFRSTLPSHTRSPSCSCASLTVVSSREDLHLQDRAHAGRTKNPRPKGRGIGCTAARTLRGPPSFLQRPADAVLGNAPRGGEYTRHDLTGVLPSSQCRLCAWR
jgi:hypothetical protein